jgi:hypothetical protein
MAMASSSIEAPTMAASSSVEASAMAAAEPKLPAGLGGDVAIAAPGSTADGRGYVGVWAKDAAGCAQIAQATQGSFAVITTSTFRDGPGACYGNFGALADGKASLKMGCTSGQRMVAIEQTTPDTLTIDGTAMVRCKP